MGREPDGTLMLMLVDIARDPTLIATLDVGNVAAVLIEISAIEARLAVRLAHALDEHRDDPEERLLDVREASDLLRVSTDWLRRRPGLPFEVRVGGNVRFSAAGIKRWIRQGAGKAA